MRLAALALALALGLGIPAALAEDPPELETNPPPDPVWPPAGQAAPMPKDMPALPPGTVGGLRKPIPRIGDQLAQTRWRALTIAGRPVVKGSEPVIEFLEDDHVRGSTGCNRFVGPFATRVDKAVIGPLDATRMGCPPQLQRQDQSVIDTLQRTVRLALEEKDQVLLVYARGATQPSKFGRLP